MAIGALVSTWRDSVPLAIMGVSTLAGSWPQRQAWAWALLLGLGTIGEPGHEHSYRGRGVGRVEVGV